MSYSAQNIRNICLLGLDASGKTTLAENMLFLTGGTIRMGSPPMATPFVILIPKRSAVRFPSPRRWPRRL